MTRERPGLRDWRRPAPRTCTPRACRPADVPALSRTFRTTPTIVNQGPSGSNRIRCPSARSDSQGTAAPCQVHNDHTRRTGRVAIVDQAALGATAPSVADSRTSQPDTTRRATFSFGTLRAPFDCERLGVASALERQHRAKRRAFDARLRTDASNHAIEERRALRLVCVLWLWQRHLHRQQTIGIEAKLDRVKVGQRPQHESGRDEQHHRRGDLENDEAITKQSCRSRANGTPRMLPEDFGQSMHGRTGVRVRGSRASRSRSTTLLRMPGAASRRSSWAAAI